MDVWDLVLRKASFLTLYRRRLLQGFDPGDVRLVVVREHLFEVFDRTVPCEATTLNFN